MLRRKHWEAARGFALTDEVTLTIAVQAALLILGLSIREYRRVSAIIVYPTAMRSRGVYGGPAWGTVTDTDEPVVGEAHDGRGPVILAWDEVEHAARNPGRGHNVVYHEFAHKLDMLDDIIDGTPPLATRAPTSPGGSRSAPTPTKLCAPGSTVRPSIPTARQIPRSSSRWPRKPSSMYPPSSRSTSRRSMK